MHNTRLQKQKKINVNRKLLLRKERNNYSNYTTQSLGEKRFFHDKKKKKRNEKDRIDGVLTFSRVQSRTRRETKKGGVKEKRLGEDFANKMRKKYCLEAGLRDPEEETSP